MLALLRFHLRGAGALAQRNVLATVAAAILSLVVVPDATVVLGRIGLGMVTAREPRAVALIPFFLGLTLAVQAMPTLRLGLGGWLRSLPLGHRDHRRALVMALALPQTPILAALALALAAFAAFEQPLAPAAVLAVPLGVLAAGAVAVPVRRGWVARPVALAAGLVGALGTWPALAGGVALMMLWDLLAGPTTLAARPTERRRLAVRQLGLTVSLRALGPRIVGPIVVALFGVLAGWAYRANNGFSAAEAAFGVRLALGSALGISTVLMADALLVRRRVWPWLRSLPTTARGRVVEDALLVALPGLAAIALAIRVDWHAAAIGLAMLPVLAVAAVATLRRAGGRLLGVTGSLLWVVVPATIVVAQWPLMAVAALAAVPVALGAAVRADRRLIVTGWQPLHHAAAGDSLAGSDR